MEACAGAHQLTKEDAITVATIERGVPILVRARELVEGFHQIVRDRDPDALPSWIADAAGSVLAAPGFEARRASSCSRIV